MAKKKTKKKKTRSVPSFAGQKTVTNTQVGKSDCKMWVFSHGLGDEKDYFVLACPVDGFVFSEDPFENDRAVNHFCQCNISVEDKNDIVQRFGLQGKTQPQSYCCHHH